MSEHEHEDCRVYVNHVQLQYRHLQQMMERLRPLVFGAAGCESAFGDARQLLADAHDCFAKHVAEETGGGCLEEAVSRCPRLSPEVRELDAQFPRVTAALEQIAARFEKGNRLTTNHRLVAQELEQLAHELNQLEHNELRILREAFGADESCPSISLQRASN